MSHRGQPSHLRPESPTCSPRETHHLFSCRPACQLTQCIPPPAPTQELSSGQCSDQNSEAPAGRRCTACGGSLLQVSGRASPHRRHQPRREHQGRVQYTAGHQPTPGAALNLHRQQQGLGLVRVAPLAAECEPMRAVPDRQQATEKHSGPLTAPNAQINTDECILNRLPTQQG